MSTVCFLTFFFFMKANEANLVTTTATTVFHVANAEKNSKKETPQSE